MDCGLFILSSSFTVDEEQRMRSPRRLSKIEADLAELKNLLKNSDGLEEIRTPDLRHVKATS
jgi:hypothetical protein